MSSWPSRRASRGAVADAQAGGVDSALARCVAAFAGPNAGIIGARKASQGGAFGSITGSADFKSGLDDKDIQGGLIGNQPGDASGGFGYGFGKGSGGTGMGTIGTGKYGTLGHGTGA